MWEVSTLGLSVRRLTALVVISSLALWQSSGVLAADALQRIDLNKGTTVDVYFEVNVDGKLYVRIAAKPGESNCADFWWIKWPFGNVESLGRHCDFASFSIPGIMNLAYSAKLRAGGTTNNVKLGVSATESVAHSSTFNF